MGVCCVDGCESDGEETVYFPVPIAPALRRKWRDAIQSSTRLHQDSRVCSRHFHRTDYERVRGKLRLKARVVPSLFGKEKFEKEQCSPKLSPRVSPERESAPSPTGGQEEEQHGCREGGPYRDHHDVELTAPKFGLLRSEEAADREGVGEGDSATCTIECVPEAILHQDSDSRSETDLHKEDIEDIIANYHIQQHRQLVVAGRTGTEHRGESGTEDSGKSDAGSEVKPSGDTDNRGETRAFPPDRERRKKKLDRAERDRDSNSDDDLVEVEVPGEVPPQFIEISVDAGKNGQQKSAGAGQDDCLIVLEKVEVDIDPASLMLQPGDMDEDRREDPISLLTSSDESDVIIEEPHIDTVEVSSETDEDDRPLVSLLKSRTTQSKLTRLLWGNLVEYYCYQCKFTTLSKAESERHKLQHSKILLVCPACDFTCSSSSQLSRHRKRHKDEKRYRCHHCDYKARHSMSLVYHMKAHEGAADAGAQQVTDLTPPERYRCDACRYGTSARADWLRHRRTCSKRKRKNKRSSTHKCGQCAYATKRRSDLRRHRERKHAASDEYED